MIRPFFAGILCCLFFSHLPLCGKSQIASNPTTGVTSVQFGLWSVMNNPSGLSTESGFSAGFYYQSAFLMHELADAGVAVGLMAGKFSVVGLSYRQFGYSLYKEQQAGLTLAKKLGKSVSAGVRFDYVAIAFGEGYGRSGFFTGTAGVMVNITEQLRIGISVFNPQRVKYSKSASIRYPATMSGGIAWRFGSHAELSLGAEKSGDAKEQITCAMDYAVSSKFKLHAGFGTGVRQFFFGYTIRFGSMEVAMNSGYHQLLGFSPQFLLTYKRK